ncbi:ATP-binding protein [Rhizobium sp. SG570]|uniref:ATP-binding protein n=1 Tax=Rhizobium sp. SG570 TaxID=2587113 RepID=UPI001444B174|nr:ATP-binding protein [Rhizobium sp. SG570]NKJ38744.1 hypothetical protein [Rhizobium sp. SG570]
MTTFHELEAFIADEPAESVLLEYKSSKILSKGEHQAICKAVSAFANSAGGRFIIGVDASGGRLRLDGGWTQASKLDWLYRTINDGTFPSVETASVIEIVAETGRYYIVNVKVSPRAPHQSQDHKYYKRRGSHSDPMEHYEIEDVRNRPKAKLLPLEVSLHFERTLLSIKFRNCSQAEIIDDLKIDVETNFPNDEGLLRRLKSRGIKQMRPGTEHVFLLGAISGFLKANEEAAILVSSVYRRGDVIEREAAEFHLSDYLYTSIVEPPIVDAIRKVGQKIDDVTSAIGKLVWKAEAWEDMRDATGLRLSQRTLRGLLREDQRFDPDEFSWQAYAIILGIEDREAIDLHHVFTSFPDAKSIAEEYCKRPEELRLKFERYFKAPGPVD